MPDLPRRRFLLTTAAAAGAVVLGSGRAAASDSEKFPTGLLPMGATEKAFSAIDGVPVYYDRNGGLQVYTFRCTFAFYDRLVAWKRRLAALSAGYGGLSYFASAGTYVNKPGAHGLGRAIDIDQVVWAGAAWGPRTDAAFNTATARLGVTGNPHTSSTAWISWTERAAARGFANQPF